ncbi:MAG: SRPBCC domain-containing protein [Saprospiraceae bacterium]|nr:SRPBCC domain-containing protein [Saprospiraceae bacterium]
MSISSSDWSKFCQRITVNASIGDLYKAWTTQEGLESWFLRKAEFTKPDGSIRPRNESIQKGDQYSWLWHGHPDSAEERNQVLEANGKDTLQFTFTETCAVTVHIKSEAGENVVELWQENIPLEDDPKRNLHVQCSVGWTFYLANLKSILEGGIDLRNKNENIKSVVNS